MSGDIGAAVSALSAFADNVKAKLAAPYDGEAEDQLRAPFEALILEIADLLGKSVVAKGEVRLAGRLGKPDFAILADGPLVGLAELKAPGKGADPEGFKGRDRKQWERFKAVPNLLYTDGNEWSLFRQGERLDFVRLPGNVAKAGARAVDEDAARALVRLIERYLAWAPVVPADFRQLAEVLAPLCRLLREEVEEALKDPKSNLVSLAAEWRQLLFADASDAQFADGYAQTVTFALLLARLEGADIEDVARTSDHLQARHSLLGRTLQILADPKARQDIDPALLVLQRVINQIRSEPKSEGRDPWLYFYEDFLSVYDRALRKDAGVYYTPVEVVRCQVRLIDELLETELDKPLGFADADVITLDPAVGTGTYLLGVIDHALEKIRRKEGEGATAGRATTLARNIHGFEQLVGPYSVAEVRVSRALAESGAILPKDGLPVFLTDTLESPSTKVLELGFMYKPLSDQHKRALEVKDSIPVLVCLGNPPYDRHAASTDEKKGGWVRYGDSGDGSDAKLRDFLDPAKQAGHGGHLKNLYNLYVYFWRWALWKVFEHRSSSGPGVVSFITASSYLVGPGFAGMREHLRRVCDEIWIINLGGEARGTRRDENIFAIQTPVAVAIAFRKGKPNDKQPATVRYVRLEGTRGEKLARLDRVKRFRDIKWQACPSGWQDKFWPKGKGEYFNWPSLSDLFPWQHSGVKAGRTWVIAGDRETLSRRWTVLCKSSKTDRARLFKESPTGCKIENNPPPPLTPKFCETKIQDIRADAPLPDICRYGFRSFDRAWIFADSRLLDRPGPPLWKSHGERQIYLTTISTNPVGLGPAVTCSPYIPDGHFFRGSFGAKDVYPLYTDASTATPNISPWSLRALSKIIGEEVKPEPLLSYCYSVLAQPHFSERFFEELNSCEIRVPITKDAKLFQRAAALGRRLLWLHTYGERFVPRGKRPGQVPRGRARCVKAVSERKDEYPETFSCRDGTVYVGTGEFAPVPDDVWDFEVSGLKVVQSWLGYRMKERRGKKSSPLDEIHPEHWTAEFTSEFLDLLWILEATLEIYPKQAALLDEILQGPLVMADELPEVPEALRRPPKFDGDYYDDIENCCS